MKMNAPNHSTNIWPSNMYDPLIVVTKGMNGRTYCLETCISCITPPHHTSTQIQDRRQNQRNVFKRREDKYFTEISPLFAVLQNQILIQITLSKCIIQYGIQ